jgi:hypothetical protein
MRVHEVAQTKSENFSDLSIDASALYLLAAPSTPVAVRDAVIARAEAGERITHGEVKRLVVHTRPSRAVFAPPSRKAIQAIADRAEERAAVNEPAPTPVVIPERTIAELTKLRERVRARAADVSGALDAYNKVASEVAELAQSIEDAILDRLDGYTSAWRQTELGRQWCEFLSVWSDLTYGEEDEPRLTLIAELDETFATLDEPMPEVWRVVNRDN